MTPAEIGRIFMAFTQGDHAGASKTSHRFGGLGLGLAITKMLVEMHGGKVSAASPGREQGSSFTIELPLSQGAKETVPPAKKDSTPPLTPVAARPPSAVNGTGGIRVLLVEDHAATRLTLTQLLKHRGYDVTSAASASEALRQAQAQAQKFDLVISDVGLSDGTGLDLMKQLRARHGLQGIALSGYGMEEDLQRTRDAGFVAHLVKPVAMKEIRRALSQFIAAKS